MRAFILICSLFFVTSHPGAAEKSCRTEIGEKAAARLVRQCIQVSPATHPPCNAGNSCQLIRGEIQRGCGLLTRAANAPKFCKAHQDVP